MTLILIALTAAFGQSLNDLDGDGFDATLDCDDYNADVHPGADERCNGWDDNCDGRVDDDDPNLTDGSLWYTDDDGDGVGDLTDGDWACVPPPGTVPDSGDCDDSDPSIHPDAFDACDNIDQNCDGTIDPNCSPQPHLWVRSHGPAGTVLTFSVTGGAPNTQHGIMMGLDPANSFTDPAYTLPCGATVEIVDPQYFDSDMTDVNGEAWFDRITPAGAAGHSYIFYAVDHDHCAISDPVVLDF